MLIIIKWKGNKLLRATHTSFDVMVLQVGEICVLDLPSQFSYTTYEIVVFIVLELQICCKTCSL